MCVSFTTCPRGNILFDVVSSIITLSLTRFVRNSHFSCRHLTGPLDERRSSGYSLSGIQANSVQFEEHSARQEMLQKSMDILYNDDEGR